MKKTMIWVFLFGLALSSAAQQEKNNRDKDNRWHHRKGNFMPSISRNVGVSFQHFNGLNGRVSGLPQYKQLKDHAGTLGLGWMKEEHRIVTAGDINIGSSMSGHRDEKSSTYRYIGLGANLGYDVLKSEKITLYPFAGLGYQWYQALFFRDNSAVNFNDVLQSAAMQNSISSVRFNNSFFVYRAGIGVAFKSPKEPSTSIGLQAGYTGSFKKRAWRSNEGQTLANAPEDRISQFYISLVFTSKPGMMMR